MQQDQGIATKGLNELLREMFIDADIAAGKSMCYDLKRGQSIFHCYEVGRRQFCWTIHPDTNGDYWTFEYVLHGRGKKMFQQMVHKTRAARKKVAQARAQRRYEAYCKRRNRIADVGFDQVK